MVMEAPWIEVSKSYESRQPDRRDALLRAVASFSPVGAYHFQVPPPAYACMHMYVCMYVCMCICMYTYICMLRRYVYTCYTRHLKEVMDKSPRAQAPDVEVEVAVASSLTRHIYPTLYRGMCNAFVCIHTVHIA